MKLLGHGLKVLEMVFEEKLCRILTARKMQFSFLHEKERVNAVFILRSLQEERRVRGIKLYTFFLELDKAFESVPKKVFKMVMRKKEILEVLVVWMMRKSRKVKSVSGL